MDTHVDPCVDAVIAVPTDRWNNKVTLFKISYHGPRFFDPSDRNMSRYQEIRPLRNGSFVHFHSEAVPACKSHLSNTNEYFVLLRDAVRRARRDGRRDAVLRRGEALLATGAQRVLEAASADRIHWHETRDRTVADAVRIEILKVLADFERR